MVKDQVLQEIHTNIIDFKKKIMSEPVLRTYLEAGQFSFLSS